MKLTDKQRRVLVTLHRADMPQTPTEIGEACGQTYARASSWANGALRSLEKAGMVDQPTRKGPWQITDAGREHVEGGNE